MNSYRHKGDSIPVTTPAEGMVSGKLYKIGSLIGVAALTSLEGAPNELKTTGVFELSKTSAQGWSLGDPVYLDTENAVLSTTATAGFVLVGMAAKEAANPSATGRVRLNGVSAPAPVA